MDLILSVDSLTSLHRSWVRSKISKSTLSSNLNWIGVGYNTLTNFIIKFSFSYVASSISRLRETEKSWLSNSTIVISLDICTIDNTPSTIWFSCKYSAVTEAKWVLEDIPKLAEEEEVIIENFFGGDDEIIYVLLYYWILQQITYLYLFMHIKLNVFKF